MEQDVFTVGLDLAKNAFQVHAIAPDGSVPIRRTLRRSEIIRFFAVLSPFLVGMGSYASEYYWTRELIALSVLTLCRHLSKKDYYKLCR